jgi:hypothetical protein
MHPLKLTEIKDKIITIRGERVIIDCDVAELYGVETRDINKAVKNNPDKFPKGYVFEVDNKEFTGLRWKFSTTNLAKIRVLPKAVTEKGLYMLATILKSQQATQTTLSIIEAFAQLRELQRTVAELSEAPDEFQQKSLMQKGGEIIADLIGDELKTSDTETSFELNFAVLKFQHTIKRKI